MSKITNFYCDACGNEIDEEYVLQFAGSIDGPHGPNKVIKKDLCPDCWGKIAEILDITNITVKN